MSTMRAETVVCFIYYSIVPGVSYCSLNIWFIFKIDWKTKVGCVLDMAKYSSRKSSWVQILYHSFLLNPDVFHIGPMMSLAVPNLRSRCGNI